MPAEEHRPGAELQNIGRGQLHFPRQEADNASSDHMVQDGVRRIEGVSRTWSGRSLWIPYGSIMLMAFAASLETQVTSSLLPFVTSSFQRHSLVSTILVVRGVIDAVIKPPVAKFADVFGRLEAFCLSVSFFVLGYIQMARAKNVQTFASAQIFFSAGSNGILILTQIFIADTTDLSYRALFSTLPDLPFLATIWFGPVIGERIMNNTGSWRWAYGMWTIIVPFAFLPLAFSLWVNGQRAKQLGLAPDGHIFLKGGPLEIVKNLWRDLDVGGIIILSGGFALILVPCTLARTTAGGWSNEKIIAMVTVGALLLAIFPFWETSSRLALRGRIPTALSRLAPYPLIPLHLLKSRTFSAGAMLAVFYFMVFFLSVYPYFQSYLMVVRGLSLHSAQVIVSIFNMSSTVASFIVSWLIKFTHHYKWFVTAGASLYMLGMGLMMRYRTEDAPLSAIVGTQILIGLGGGMLNVPAQLGVQASAGHQHVAAATAVFLTLTSVGGAIGSAISGDIWNRHVPEKLRDYLPDDVRDQAAVIFGDINEALAYSPGTPERDAINRSYQEAMTTLLTIALCACVPIILCSLLMENLDLSKIQQGVTGRVIGGEVDVHEHKVGDRRSHARRILDWLRRHKADSVESD